MLVPERSIFRPDAIKHYTQNRDKDILPRFVSFPVSVFLWLLLALFIVAGVLAWSTSMPVYANGAGTVLHEKNEDASVVTFFSPSLQVRPGLRVLVHVGATGPYIHGKIVQVLPYHISPYVARQRYELAGSSASTINQPSIVALIKLDRNVPLRNYAGTTVTVRVEIGSQRVISLLPFLGGLVGE